MSRKVYRYDFAPEVDLEDVQTTLTLALLAVESLHGETAMHLDASHFLDLKQRAAAIDCGSPLGRDLNKLFAGYLLREFGREAFRVRRARKETASTDGLSDKP
jgi:hypothetical protein